MSEKATTRQERPAFFPKGDDTLFGVITDPIGESKRTAVILAYGGGYTMTSYYNQYWTRMARRVAELGFHALRFDHHGNGDATGRVGYFDHAKPFTADMEAAVRFLQEEGVERFLLVGDCLGGRTALEAAANLDVVDGVFMISAMVRDGRMDKSEDWAQSYSLGHYVKRAFRWSTVRKLADRDMRRAFAKVAGSKIRQVSTSAASSVAVNKSSANGIASSRFLDPMAKVLDRGCSVCLVYGREDEERFGEFEEAKTARLGEILEGASPAVEVEMVDGTIVDIQDVIAQDQIIDLVADWVTRVPNPTVAAS